MTGRHSRLFGLLEPFCARQGGGGACERQSGHSFSEAPCNVAFDDLTAPLALGVAEVPARRCPRLSGRGSPRGFVEGYALSGRASACAQQPLSPCGRPVNRGAHPSPATGQGEKTRDAPYKKAPEMGAFLYGINEPSAWEN